MDVLTYLTKVDEDDDIRVWRAWLNYNEWNVLSSAKFDFWIQEIQIIFLKEKKYKNTTPSTFKNLTEF